MPSEAFKSISSAVVAIPLDRRIPGFEDFVTKFKREFLVGLTDAAKVGVQFASPPAIIPLLWIGEIKTEEDLERVSKPIIGLFPRFNGIKVGVNGVERYYSHYNKRGRQEVGLKMTGSIGEVREVSMRLSESLSSKGATKSLISDRNGDRMIYIARLATLDSGLAVNAYENKRPMLDTLLNIQTLGSDLVNRIVVYGYAEGDEGGAPVEIVTIEGFKEPKAIRHSYNLPKIIPEAQPTAVEQPITLKNQANLQSAA